MKINKLYVFNTVGFVFFLNKRGTLIMSSANIMTEACVSQAANKRPHNIHTSGNYQLHHLQEFI